MLLDKKGFIILITALLFSSCLTESNKKFVSNQGWFEFQYPSRWTQTEEDEGTYLFLDNNDWKGNLRITPNRILKKDSLSPSTTSLEFLKKERSKIDGAEMIKLGNYDALQYRNETIQDDDSLLIDFWEISHEYLILVCSFTINKSDSEKPKVKEERNLSKEVLGSIKFNPKRY